jgi:hypothetical protein
MAKGVYGQFSLGNIKILKISLRATHIVPYHNNSFHKISNPTGQAYFSDTFWSL